MQNAFVELLKVTKQIVLWYDEFVLYSSIASYQISIYGLEYGLGMHCFKLTWACLIAKVAGTRSKFLELSAYST